MSQKHKPYIHPQNITKYNINPQRSSILEKNLFFSFKYLDLYHKKFKIPDKDFKYLNILIERLREVCKLTLEGFRVDNAKSLHSHEIKWDKCTESGFENLPAHLQDGDDWQFSVTKVKYGRIHGVLIDNYFYIVWLDRNHSLCPTN